MVTGHSFDIVRLLKSRSLSHCFWGAMLLVHLPALVAGWQALLAGRSADLEAVTFVALNLSAVLFVLKVHGARWLEFDTRPGSLLALGLSIVLVHINVAGSPQAPPALPAAPPIVAGVLLAASLVRVQRFGRQVLASVRSQRPPLLRAWPGDGTDVRVCCLEASRTLTPRPPPRTKFTP
jgi:hypothetical protein